MKAIFCFIFDCINIFLRPFILLKLYEYFIITTFIGAPILSYWSMFGISIFICLMIREIKFEKIDIENVSEILYKSMGLTIGYLVVWGIGYIMSLGV